MQPHPRTPTFWQLLPVFASLRPLTRRRSAHPSCVAPWQQCLGRVPPSHQHNHEHAQRTRDRTEYIPWLYSSAEQDSNTAASACYTCVVPKNKQKQRKCGIINYNFVVRMFNAPSFTCCVAPITLLEVLWYRGIREGSKANTSISLAVSHRRHISIAVFFSHKCCCCCVRLIMGNLVSRKKKRERAHVTDQDRAVLDLKNSRDRLTRYQKKVKTPRYLSCYEYHTHAEAMQVRFPSSIRTTATAVCCTAGTRSVRMLASASKYYDTANNTQLPTAARV